MTKFYKRIDFSIIFSYLYLLFPYLGKAGSRVFSALGKNYYIILCFFLFSVVCYRLVSNQHKYEEPSSELELHLSKIDKRKIYKFFTILLCLLFVSYFVGNSVNNVFFAVMLIVYFYEFYTLKINTETLKAIGFISTIMIYIISIFSSINGRFSYFNPNSYAYISTLVFLFSCFFTLFTKKFSLKVLTIINFIMSIYNTEFIYKSETQLLSIAFFACLLIFGSLIYTSKFMYKSFNVFVFVIVCCIPFICYLLISKGILTTDIFTTRGERWVNSINSLKNSLFIKPGDNSIGAHNGFLDMCLKYGYFISILFVLALLHLIQTVRLSFKNVQNILLYYIFMTLLFMNIVESFFMGLTDSYFYIFVVAILYSRKNSYINLVKKEII